MRDKINDALKDAVKSQDKRRVSTLRLINAAIKDRDISSRECGRDRIDDADILEVLAKMVKQRADSASQYQDAGRIDLAEQELEEIAIIREFLPKQMDEAEISACCKRIVDEIGASGLCDMGKTMATLKARFAGQMDFSKASGVVREMLR